MLENTYIASEWTIKGDFHGGSKGEEKTFRESLNLLRQCISGHKQKVGKNINGEGHSDEVSDGNEEHVIGN